MKTISTPSSGGLDTFRIIIKMFGIFSFFLVHAVYADAVYMLNDRTLKISGLYVYERINGGLPPDGISPLVVYDITLKQIGPKRSLDLLGGETEYELIDATLSSGPKGTVGPFTPVFFTHKKQGHGYVPAVQFPDGPGGEAGGLSYRLQLTLNSPGRPGSLGRPGKPVILGVHDASLNGYHTPDTLTMTILNSTINNSIIGDISPMQAAFTSLVANGNVVLGNASADEVTIKGTMQGTAPLVFDGATAGANTTALAVTDPTADNTITLPDASGAVVLEPETGCGSGQVLSSNGAGVWNCANAGGTSDNARLSADVAHVNVEEILSADWVNTANPWADNEVADKLSIFGGTVDYSVIGGTIPMSAAFTDLDAHDNVVLGDAYEDSITVNGTVQGAIPLVFDGATTDANNTALTIADPTAGNTIILPDASGTVMLDPSGCASGQVLSSDGAGGWNCTTGAGDNVTSVTAGTGLSGSGSGTGAVTLDVDFGTAAGQVAQGSHTHAAADISSGTLDDTRLSTDVAHVNVAETLSADWVNTDNPWLDDEVSDKLSIFGGTVDYSVIGGVIPMQAAFTDLDAKGNVVLGDASADSVTVKGTVQGDTPLVFDGATADANNTALTVTDPTAGNTITLPDASGAVVLEPETGCGSGQLLSSDGAGRWNCATDAGATSVTAGAGLSGGGSGAVTLDVDFGTAAGQVAQGSHTHNATTISSGVLDDARLSTNVAHVNVAETLSADWVNTANPWADNEVADNLSISGGTVDNSVIGNVTPMQAAFTDLDANGNVVLGDASADSVTVKGTVQGDTPLVFEGATADANNTALAVTDPTAGNTITLPDASGAVVLEPEAGCGSGQVLSSNGAGVWNCTTDAGGSLTSVTAGTGLSGGGSSAVTLDVDFGTAAGQVAQGSHTHNATVISSGILDDARLSTNVAHVNVVETLSANWVNTINPWANNEVADNLTINGGTVNNTVIGAAVPSAGTFSALTATGNVALGDSGADTVTVTGALTISSGTPGADKVLTSNASGNASWQAPGDWRLNGNSGTTAGTNFVGTTDNQDLVFKVNNTQALRLRYNTISPNLIGGLSTNSVASGLQGATIGGGGGYNGLTNQVSDNYGTIGGGSGNVAGNSNGSYLATVGGGYFNRSIAMFATVGGGDSNLSQGIYATVGGGNQ
ncbi:MAG: hypothetical protein GY862_08215 [Gammaproteobacteria bacterium]|nr:hypothetical protein [Gammaproteobacteria bacterium]